MRTNYRWLSGILLSTALLLSACNFMSMSDSPNDETITSDIQAKLFADPTLKHHDIRVATNEGVVTVSGEVSTEF
jgi:osmotically-inducible protein OsmY